MKESERPMRLPEFLDSDDAGFVHVKGHRIGLHHILRLYKAGHSPEMIVASYPTLSLSLVHKVIAFYLDHLAALDTYIAEQDRAMAEQMAASQPGPGIAELRARLEAKRQAEIRSREMV